MSDHAQHWKIAFRTILVLLATNVMAFDLTPTQPGADTTYRLTDVYTLPGGQQKSVALNPAGLEALIMGGTTSLLSTLQTEFPAWTFSSAESDLAGAFNVESYYACGTGTTDCGTERSVPGTIVGNFIDITYAPGTGDPTAAGNDLHWIQRLTSNHALGAGGGHGINVDKIDNDSGDTDPVLGDCDDVPYYDCGYFAGETFFVDRPSRTADSENDHVWSAELYLVEETAPQTVTIYNGVRWGWVSTDSDVRALTAPPSSIRFHDPAPPVGGATVATGIGTNDITWGRAVSESFPSALSIRPNTLDLTPLIGEPFLLGTITYSNGTIQSGSGLSSVNLTVETTIDVPDMMIAGLAIDDTRVVSMINTLNTCNARIAGDCTAEEARESADYVSIPPAPDLVDVPGTFPDFGELGNNFHVLEESSATATLIGRITEVRIGAAGGGGGGLRPPGPGAPPPGVSAPPRLVWEILGFGRVLEGEGFITAGRPGNSVPDRGDGGTGIVGPGTVVTVGQSGDTVTLGRNDTVMLGQVAVTLRKNPRLRVTLHGHAASSGSPRKDQASSLERARLVRDALLEHGVDAKRIEIVGHGSSRPVANSATTLGRVSNPRVELEIVGQDRPQRKGELSVEDQFREVMKKYPAVAEHLVESDAVIDFYSGLNLLDGHLLNIIDLGPDATRRLQDAVRLSECLNAGLPNCYRMECGIGSRDCDRNCDAVLGDFQRALCIWQEQECRTATRWNCVFVPER